MPDAKAAHASGIAPAPSPERIWSYLMGTRVLVAIVLLAAQLPAWWLGLSSIWLLFVCAFYLVSTVAVLRWSRPAISASFWSPGWSLTLWLDLALFSLLEFFQPGSLNFTPLFILPVLLAAINGPLFLALGSAACATIVVLINAYSSTNYQAWQTGYAQAAIIGVGLFLLAWLAHQLAKRVRMEQAQAQRSQTLAAAQGQVNRVIVAGLSEGVLVLDAQGEVWHANPAACAMLGAQAAPAPYDVIQTLPGWPMLAKLARNTLLSGQDSCCELSLPAPDGRLHHLLLRAQLAPATDELGQSCACVLFMEDLRDVESRVRNEKLAAMGRVSAAVAHEIRNPLAAIAQANALLAEETLSPIQHHLTRMIGKNAKRLGRTVDDILNVARLPAHPAAAQHRTCLDETVGATLADWQAQRQDTPAPQWRAAAPGLNVRFDAEHLHRVLINLLDNANAYGSGGSGAIEVSTSANTDNSAQLAVWNPGPPMPANVAQSLFEPFASSHSRSSGLGLYLSRQLCEHHGAQLSYQPSQRHGVAGHEFVLLLRT